MVWLLRLGLGAIPRGPGESAAMAWEEVLITPGMDARRRNYVQHKVAEAMIESAVRIAHRIDPLLVNGGQTFDAAFTALARAHQGGDKHDARHGPAQIALDHVGVAIAASRAATAAGIATLRELAGGAIARQFSQERTIDGF